MPLLIDTECDDCRTWFTSDADRNNHMERAYGRLLCPSCRAHATRRTA